MGRKNASACIRKEDMLSAVCGVKLVEAAPSLMMRDIYANIEDLTGLIQSGRAISAHVSSPC